MGRTAGAASCPQPGKLEVMSPLHLWVRSAALAGLFLAPLAAQSLPDDWAQRDLEGKWSWYRQDMSAHQSDADLDREMRRVGHTGGAG